MTSTDYQLLLLASLLCACWLPVSAAQDNCSNNFFLMEESLLESAENRFNLLVAFYPPREAHPVMVEVDYTFQDLTNDSQRWFWSESEFYLIQPLEVLQFTSLLFSNMPYRSSRLSISLPPDCSLASVQYFQLLTTRLKLYSQSPTTSTNAGTQRMTDNYIAVAASQHQISKDSLQNDFTKVWIHLTTALFPIATWLMLYLCDPIQLLLGDKTWTKLEDEHSHGTLAALIQIAVIFTMFVFFLDVAGIYFTITSNLISYDSNSAFYLSTVTGVLVDAAAFLWVMFVLVTCTLCDVRSGWRQLDSGEQFQSSGSIKKLVSTVTVAPILCFANHLPYVIIAFISDPFHAGSFAIVYTIAFFLYFFIFRQFYNRMVLHSNKRPTVVKRLHLCNKCTAKERLWHPNMKNDSSTIPLTSLEDPDSKCDCFVPGPPCHTPFNSRILITSLLFLGPIVTLYQGMMIVLFYSLPITKSIEDAPSRIYTIYQGTGLIIVALLTYNIVLNPNPFSISRTLERLAKRLHLPRTTNYWNRLSDEEKCAKVIATLLETHFQRVSDQKPAKKDTSNSDQGLESEDGDVTIQTNSNDAAECRMSSV